jgi:hypothetical protein
MMPVFARLPEVGGSSRLPVAALSALSGARVCVTCLGPHWEGDGGQNMGTSGHMIYVPSELVELV